MLRDVFLVFDKKVFNVELELMFERGFDVPITTFVVDEMMVGSMISVEAEKKLR